MLSKIHRKEGNNRVIWLVIKIMDMTWIQLLYFLSNNMPYFLSI